MRTFHISLTQISYQQLFTNKMDFSGSASGYIWET